MKIEIRQKGSISLIDIIGILDTATSQEAQDQIQAHLDEGCKKLIINLSQTEYMSSSGLRVLLSTAKKLWAAEGKLRICEPNKVVKDILVTSGFSMIMEVVDGEELALTDF